MKLARSVFLLSLLALVASCGALEPKFYPESQTITSTLFPSNRQEETNREFEEKVRTLLKGEVALKGAETAPAPRQALFPGPGKLLVVNNLRGVDSEYFAGFKEKILAASPNLHGVEVISVSSLPNLHTLRLMGARQQAKYVLILNSFSNVYQYHNGWTIPTVMLFGLPYFFLDTQTIRVFSKIEYSLIDIEENIILSNESVTAEGADKAILPESGIVQFKTTNAVISEGMERLGAKFLMRLAVK